MSNIQIRREEAGHLGRYVAMVEGLTSEMTYVLRGRRGGAVMEIQHTGVPKALSGRGVGLALVRRAVEEARSEGFRIDPQCSFVRVMMERHADLGDVRASKGVGADGG